MTARRCGHECHSQVVSLGGRGRGEEVVVMVVVVVVETGGLILTREGIKIELDGDNMILSTSATSLVPSSTQLNCPVVACTALRSHITLHWCTSVSLPKSVALLWNYYVDDEDGDCHLRGPN